VQLAIAHLPVGIDGAELPADVRIKVIATGVRGLLWSAVSLPCPGKGSRYRSGRSPDWIKSKNPNAPAVKREAEEDWGQWPTRRTKARNSRQGADRY
jgi:hypothetical protein